MADFSIEFWYWWVAAAVLVILEIFAPGVIFIWLAVAAGIVGVITLVIPSLDWRIAALIFAVLSVAAIAVYRAYLRRRPTETEDSTLNRRGEQYVGRVYTLVDAIEAGSGRIKVGDSTWRVEGDDLPAGKRVRVTSVDGVVLRVEKAE